MRVQWRRISWRWPARAVSSSTAPMLPTPAPEGKGRSRTTAMRDSHHRIHERATYSAAMEQSAEILPFAQAPDGVEIRHLRAFVAVAEELNFSRAAERIYVSQPALSRQIRALERLVGPQLLRRSTHRVELTVAGDALLDRARRLLADLDEAVATAQSVGGELAGRMARMWAPVAETASAGETIEELREEYERFMAQAPMPPDIEVGPVTAGGVPALRIGSDPRIL